MKFGLILIRQQLSVKVLKSELSERTKISNYIFPLFLNKKYQMVKDFHS